ncbi:MAG: thioredoxin family protein [Phycisphaerae bacterium]|nr:MAG: thioredoxin family protein [Phycisphaerae bacterium]
MKKATALCLSIFAVAAFSLVARAEDKKDEGHGHDHAHAELGKAAPEFTLKDLDGKEHKLSEYKGKVVVLEWTCCTCPFVVRHQKQERTMQNTFEGFKDKEVVWLAIDSTKPDHGGGYSDDMIKRWKDSKDVKLPYAILRDAEGKVGHVYGAKTTPHMYVINKEGVLVYSGAIDDNPHGSKKEATNYVTKAVEASLAGSDVEVASTKPYGCGVKYAG